MKQKVVGKSMKTKNDIVYDGFCERSFDEDIDGWMNEQLDELEVPSVKMAKDVLTLYNEVNELRRENWELKKRLSHWE